MDFSEVLTTGSPRAQLMALFSSNCEEQSLPNHVIVFLQLHFLEVTTNNSYKIAVDLIRSVLGWPGKV